jgi:ankyrin repeat protein
LFRAIAAGDDRIALDLLASSPSLIDTCNPEGWRPLHAAARRLNLKLLEWLLERGADPAAPGRHGLTPLDAAAYGSGEEDAETFRAAADLLTAHGAPMTAFAAAALGDAEWLRARHAEGTLANPVQDAGGLLRIAVSHNRPELLALLLDFGFDPDERMRAVEFGGDDIVFSWGMPLWHCAGSGRYRMAEMLLERGADPNASVYASGDPVFQAYSRRDWKMVHLLERYGGIPTAHTAAIYHQRDLVARMLSGEAKYRLEDAEHRTLAHDVLLGAACGGAPEIVRLALAHIDWRPEDPRWVAILEQPLRMWRHGVQEGWDRAAHLACFRLLLDRCDPNLRGRETDGRQFGLTILHSVAGAREHVSPEERLGFATMLLDAGARLDIRDHLLKSTPLGWACRYGRPELVRLFLERGADPVEADAEPWATPLAWARRMGHTDVLSLLSRTAS